MSLFVSFFLYSQSLLRFLSPMLYLLIQTKNPVLEFVEKLIKVLTYNFKVPDTVDLSNRITSGALVIAFVLWKNPGDRQSVVTVF